MISYIRTLLKDADAFLAAHPQFVTAVLTAGAAWLANYGFKVTPTVLASVVSLVLAIVSGITSNSAHRAAKRNAPSARR